MNTADLREFLYQKSMERFEVPFTRNETNVLADLFFEFFTDALVTEGKLLIRDWGKWEVVTRKGRTYKVRGTEVTVQDRKTVTFSPGAKLTKAIRGEE